LTGPTIGRAEIEVGADGSPFIRELRDSVHEGVDKNEPEFKKAGKEIGDTVSNSMEKEIEKNGPHFAKSIERGIKKTKVKVKPDLDFAEETIAAGSRKLGHRVAEEIAEAVGRESRPGGIFNRVGLGIADAIGAGFNVSGRSPLIVLLIPLLGVIVALVIGAVQAAGSLVAILTTIPGLILNIVLYAGVLVLAFQGMGDAIKNAFKAKNAKELKEALKGLTPSAREFVKSLLPLEKVFGNLKKTAQEGFFKGFGKSLQPLINLLSSPVISNAIGSIATALGQFAGHIAKAFGSAAFVNFINTTVPSIMEFLKRFGPAFQGFLEGLLDLAVAVTPFLDSLGVLFSGKFRDWGDALSDLANDPKFTEWLKQMFNTFLELGDVLNSVIDFVGSFADTLNQAGGDKILKALSDAFYLLAAFFQTDVGRKAMEGLIRFSVGAIQAFTGLLLLLLLIIAGIEYFGEWIVHTLIPNLQRFWNWIKEGWARFTADLAAAWNDFTSDLAGAWKWLKDGWNRFTADLAYAWNGFVSFIKRVWGSVPTAIAFALSWLLTKWEEFKNGVALKLAFVKGKLLGIRDSIFEFFANAKTWLIQKGKDLIQGLIDGIIAKLHPLREAASVVAAVLAGAIPGSPAEYGPFAGKGAPELRGQRIAEDIAMGMRAGIPGLRASSLEAVSNINFGPGSVVANFNGTLPTKSQALSLGSSLGSGISGHLAARDTRLAVRML
jgi:hypothetical protein